MKSHPVSVFGVLVILGSAVDAQTLNIDHQPVGCAVADKFPRLEARLGPVDAVATAKVVFQGDSAEWYWVALKPEAGAYFGVLPKPKKSLKAFRYYLEVTGKALGTNRTPDYTVAVVDSSGGCQGRIAGGTAASASVLLQGPAGVAAIPPGFASTGVVAGSAAGSAAGSSTGGLGAAGVAGATVAAGGGLSGAAVAGIVVGAGAAAAGVAIAASKGGENSSSSGGSPTPTPGPSSTSYTGPFSGQQTVRFVWDDGNTVACQTVTKALSGTIRINLNQSSGGSITGSTANVPVTFSVIGNTGGCFASGHKVGDTSTATYNPTVTGSVGNLAFSSANTGEFVDFSGALNGGVITGIVTFTNTARTDQATQSGSVSIPVTLR